MELQPLKDEFAVCQLASAEGIDITKEFTFLSVTDDEVSTGVCMFPCPGKRRDG